MKKILISLLLLSGTAGFTQTVTCSDLIYDVESKLREEKTISSYVLNSTWLSKVTAYEYEGSYIIIASIKQNDWDYSGKKYVFCGVPYRNWSSFSYSYLDFNTTYGENFHKYIMDYLCYCK